MLPIQTVKKVYAGSTKRAMGIRIFEHNADIAKGCKTTALAKYCIENKLQFYGRKNGSHHQHTQQGRTNKSPQIHRDYLKQGHHKQRLAISHQQYQKDNTIKRSTAIKPQNTLSNHNHTTEVMKLS